MRTAPPLPPVPLPDPDTQPFWDGCREGQLLLQHCTGCGHVRHTPRPMCPRCRSLDHEWRPSAGTGIVVSWTVVHPPILPAFAELAPYGVVLVELPERVVIVGRFHGPADTLHTGLHVRLVFDDAGAFRLPNWEADAGVST